MSAVELPVVPPLERAPVDWERHRGNKSPKILPPPGVTWRNPSTNRKVGHRYYTRVTTFADAITESYNLTAWKLRRLLYGASQRRDYVTAAASLTLEDRDRDAFDSLVGLCLEAAGPSASLLGTALHSLTERLDRGEDLGDPPAEVLPDLAAYTALTQGLIAYAHREARVVCDELECAGTPDGHAHIAEPCPAGCGPEVLHIIDTKTGSIRYPGKMSTQLSIYAHSDLYDPATGERTPVEACRKWGAIIHLPVETGEAAAFWLDLEHGWRGAELCGPVRTWHKAKADDILRPFATALPVRVIDGEITRVESRLASTNTKVVSADPADITDQLAASLEAVAGSVRQADPSPAVDAEVVAETLLLDDEGDEAALHEDLAPATVEPHGSELVGEWIDEALETVAPVLDPVRQAFADAAAGCVHSGPTFIGPNGLTCRGCGEVVNATSTATARAPEPVEPEVVEQLNEQQLGTIGLVLGAMDRAWPGVDDEPSDYPGEAWASGPDSDAVDEGDELADEILGCITVRDLELLGTKRWREWNEQHRALAVEQHERLDHAERVAKPVAAFEAAVAAASSRRELLEVMNAAGEQPWLTPELEALASARWSEVPA